MGKDFDSWNQEKKTVDSRDTSEIYFNEGEIWWTSLGLNVGFEQDGKSEQFTRPVLILKKFSANVFVAIPLSTSGKTGKYYFNFNFLDGQSTAYLSQIRLVDSKRLVKKMGTISVEILEQIRQRVKGIL